VRAVPSLKDPCRTDRNGTMVKKQKTEEGEGRNLRQTCQNTTGQQVQLVNVERGGGRDTQRKGRIDPFSGKKKEGIA